MFPQIFGKYVLERELASGGMARVYLATLRGAVGFEKRLVVKQIRPELSLDEAFVRRFVEEAKIAVELSHPNIVPVYELGVEQGIYYIAMELCEGLTLTEILVDTGPLDAAEGAHVGIEICRALDYAHRRGNIVHRDVTPRNVLLDEEGAVRLIDFGIAAPVSAAHDRARVEVFGSPGHMPPEQIRGERLTPATDVFAVGVLLIEAWTGRPPFRRGSFQASAAALKEPQPSLARDHAELAPIAEIMLQTLALRPADRPQEAEALARKLRDFSRQFDSGDVAKRLGARVRRARRRGRSSVPWLPGDTSGPLTPAVSPSESLSSRPPSQTPATPPMAPVMLATPAHGAPITRTFAARDDLVEWTRKLGSVAPPAFDEPAPTSRPPSPPSPSSPSSPSPSPSPSSPSSPSSSPSLPQRVESHEPTTRAMPLSNAPAGIKTPFPWTASLLGAALIGLVALLSWRGTPPSGLAPLASAAPPPGLVPLASAAPPPGLAPLASAAPPPELAPLASAAAPSEAPAPSGTVPVVSASAAAVSASATAVSASATAVSASATAVSTSASAVAPPRSVAARASASTLASALDSGNDTLSAQLRMTADPQATVTVVGGRISQTDVTPVRSLKLPPGVYSVTFRSPTFGEPVVARVVLTAGAARSVHADFRAALPTVVVR